MSKLLLLPLLALLLSGCNSLTQNDQPLIQPAPGEYKVDACADQAMIKKTDEKNLVNVIHGDTVIIVCLRGEVTQWIGWNAIREKDIPKASAK